ncbi:N-6 DNA methylase [Sphingomonas sp. Sphisp140]|uniref:type I restriction-modification system subunit M n=1 Tax=unclassified Sphingomonas TaxID=196159 RepID=UPI0039B01B8F
MATSGTDLGFESELFKAADKLRGNLEPSEYKHIALGLIFLKYVSDAFDIQHAKLEKEEFADPEDPEEYLAERVFWVPPIARWSHLKANARAREIPITDPVTGAERKVDIGGLIDAAMEAIEKANAATLKGVLPKNYGSPTLDKVMIGDLVMLFSDIDMRGVEGQPTDLLGRAYEYFLSGFAGAEGRRGGEFFTPRSVVRVIVEMLEPYKGRVYDPCCGSGGMFVQSEQFIEDHADQKDLDKARRQISIYGQERNNTTWKLAKMNLAVRGIDADIQWNNEGSFLRDAFPTQKFDFIMANPPFNVSDWWRESLAEDARWQHFGTPPQGNANFAWLSHIYHHLAPRGTAGVVLANGSMSSQSGGEGDIRRQMVEKDAVDCMIALPGQLFYSTQIPACLWFLARDKSANGHRNRKGEVLFIDARNMGFMADRTRRDFSDREIEALTETYHRWRAKPENLEPLGLKPYEDVPGFCRSVSRSTITKEGYVLTPGRYVGNEEEEDDGFEFEGHLASLLATLEKQFSETLKQQATVLSALNGVSAHD